MLTRGINDHVLEGSIAFVQRHDLSFRFIEVMRTNDIRAFFERHHLVGAEIADRFDNMGSQRLAREQGAGTGVLVVL